MIHLIVQAEKTIEGLCKPGQYLAFDSVGQAYFVDDPKKAVGFDCDEYDTINQMALDIGAGTLITRLS
jgi:hypothetical protein